MPSLRRSLRFAFGVFAAFAAFGALAPQTSALSAQKLDPLIYTISFPQPASKTFDVKVEVPTGKRASVDLMMAIWSPGFYGIQNYADRSLRFQPQRLTAWRSRSPNQSRAAGRSQQVAARRS